MADEVTGATKVAQTKKKGFKLFEPKEGTIRWIQPLDEIPFKVQIRNLSDEEQAQIFDRHKLYPGSPKNDMKKLNAVAADMVDARIVDWEHPEAVFPGESEHYPCTGLNKQRLQNVFVRRDGDDELLTLWRLIVIADEKAEEEESKN